MRTVVAVILLILILVFFFEINTKNSTFIQEKQIYLVQHPEKLPKAEYAALLFPWFSNITANMYWLRTIQYIWSNAVSSEYRKYLGESLELITELNPYFESPYVIGQLLLPSNMNQWVERFSEEEMLLNTQKWEALWIKWIGKFCDSQKLESVFAEQNLWEIIENENYANPCKSHRIPFHLAYLYFYYLKDYQQAANYYKVVSAQVDAPMWARSLSAIMQWKTWQRDISLYMFLSLAQSSTNEESEVCQLISKEIEDIYNYISINELAIEGGLVANIELLRDELFAEEKNEEEKVLQGPDCQDYLNRAIRELSLLYLDEWLSKFKKDFPENDIPRTPEELFELWYIDFIPTDHQQYEDSGIVYRYKKDIWGFDSEMRY